MEPHEVAFEKATKLKLGKRMYSGDGDIYQLKGYPNRLVKIVYYNADRFAKIKKVCSSKNASIVKIHKCGTFTSNKSKSYYYIMDKLKPLPNEYEDTVIDIIGDFSFTKKYPYFISKKLKSFLASTSKLKYKYADIHSGNIMLDRFGNFKYIDLESFTY